MNAQVQDLYQPLLLYVKKRVNQREDAEDLTQEVFLKLSKSDSKKIENVKSWVYTIAKNTIIDYYRKSKLHLEEIEGDFVEESYNDQNAVEELSSCITSYIEQLPAQYRDIMRMHEMEGIPQKDIAQKLNMNYVTVRSKIQRGRRKLKDIFTDCCTIEQGGKGSIMDYHKKGCGPKGSAC